MTDSVALPIQRVEPAADTGPSVRPETSPTPKAVHQAPSASERQPSTRLLIEHVGGSFVYTVLDRVSGQVIARIPRESVEQLADVDGYQAGAMVNTEA